VGGHCNLPDGCYQVGTAAITDGEWSPGATGLRSAPNADYLRFIAVRARSSGYAQIGLFWRGLPVPWWLAWSAGVCRAGGPHLV
jgi:hypothetical protein